MGVIAGKTSDKILLLTGVSAILAGSISMTVGEYVSVSTQRDSEKADIRKEIEEHAKGPEHVRRELDELIGIYVDKGLSERLARQVAIELSKGDVIRVHMREELGIDIDNLSSPIKAAVFSGLSFLVGSIAPMASLLVKNAVARIAVIIAIDVVMFIAFGIISARLGGSTAFRACVRITIGGLCALAVTFGIGYVFGTM